MKFIDYYKRIQDNRDSIIDYYVKQFGPDTREMFEKRFDRIKFCFWIDPDMLDSYIWLKYRESSAQQIVDFIKNTINIKNSNDIEDKKDIKVENGTIRCDNQIIKNIIKNFFGPTMKLSNSVGEPVKFDGIWTFLEDLSETDIKSSLESYNRDENKKATLDEFILTKRCKFFKKMGYFPQNMDDKAIAITEKFDEMTRIYSKLAQKAIIYKKRAEAPLKELLEYARTQKAKEQELGNDKMAIAKSRIIGGNFVLKSEADIEELFEEEKQYTVLKNKNGKITEVIIYFDPFVDSSTINNEIHIRHEIRHAMLSRDGIIDGKIMFKTGNNITTEDGKELEAFNEYVTQRDAIEETRDSLNQGRVFIAEDIASIQESIEDRGIDGYSNYLPIGDLVISQEPLLSAVRDSQIAETNEDLYKVISLEQLKVLEELMIESPLFLPTDIKKLRKLMKELGIQDTDTKLKKQYGYEDEEQEL